MLEYASEAAVAQTFERWWGVLRRSVPALDGVRGLSTVSVLAHQLTWGAQAEVDAAVVDAPRSNSS